MLPSGRTIHDYDGPPGKSLQAIDDVGRSAIRIPRDFASLHGKDRIWLARQLGASEFVSIVEADGLISDEVRKREQAAIEMKG